MGTAGCAYLAITKDVLPMLLMAFVGGVFLVLGVREKVFGLVLTFVIMNNGYDLIPNAIATDIMFDKLWDFGFIYMTIVTATFVPNIFSKSYSDIPAFVKCFYIFLAVVIASLILSLASLPYPFLDTFRAFRAYLGYLLIPLLIVIFDKNHTVTLSSTFTKVIRFMSYIFFALLILYNVQYFLQYQFFFGYENVYRIHNREYIRSIPNFLMVSYFFVWLYTSQWLSGKRLPLWKISYIALSCGATLFTFTRGLYIVIALLFFFLLFFMAKIKAVNMARFSLATTLVLFVISGFLLSSFATPYLERMFSTTSDLLATDNQSTSAYRIQIVEDRVNMIKGKNALLGIGFVHPKDAYYDYGPFTGNRLPGELPAIWSADIAWANIIYQTGILGFVTFVFFVIKLGLFVAKQIPRYQGDLLFLQLASCFELLRNIILMFNSASYTYQTQNMALFLGISAYLHIVHSRATRISS